MYEVAKLADVSIATVSRVVNTDSRVKEKTRQKVLSAMLTLGYQPNSIAQSLATSTSNSVGVLVSELHGAFYGSMLSAIEETLRAAGKFVLVATGHDRQDREREAILLVGADDASQGCPTNSWSSRTNGTRQS
jgi:LacI family transcriptional regulator